MTNQNGNKRGSTQLGKNVFSQMSELITEYLESQQKLIVLLSEELQKLKRQIAEQQKNIDVFQEGYIKLYLEYQELRAAHVKLFDALRRTEN